MIVSGGSSVATGRPSHVLLYGGSWLFHCILLVSADYQWRSWEFNWLSHGSTNRVAIISVSVFDRFPPIHYSSGVYFRLWGCLWEVYK